MENDRQLSENLKNYLKTDFSSFITEVDAGQNTVTVRGNYTGSGSFYLCEIPPYMDVTQMTEFSLRTSLTSSTFTQSFDRYVLRDGVNYDRMLSKWVIVNEENKIVSHARYPDQIYVTQVTTADKPTGKKGLGGYFNHGIIVITDIDCTGISHTPPSFDPGTGVLHTPSSFENRRGILYTPPPLVYRLYTFFFAIIHPSKMF